VIFGGLKSLNPSNVQWIHGDNSLSYVAQLFYLSDTWRFPVGSNPDFGLNLATSLTYSGPPLPMALIQKILSIDPALQFFGIFLLFVITLQIFIGIEIGRTIGANSLQSMVIGLLQVTPFFLYRLQFHFWISSHFLLLWSLWIVLRSYKDKKIRLVEVSAVVTLAYFIGAYMLAMALLILFFPIAKETFENKKFPAAAKKVSLTVVMSVALSFFIADFGVQKGSAIELVRMNFTGQYTYYPTNLLSLFNPAVGYSRDCTKGHCIFGEGPVPSHFIENFSVTNLDLGGVQGNFDGFLYLGVGLIYLLCLSVIIEIRYRGSRGLKQLITRQRFSISYFLFVFAFSATYRITVGSNEFQIFDSKLIRWSLSTFRASGRFAWILAYTLILISITVIVRRLNSKQVTFILIFALLFQFGDMFKPLETRYSNLKNYKFNSFPLQKQISEDFSRRSVGKTVLAYYPPAGMTGWPVVSILAWENGMKSGMMATSRVNYAEAYRNKESLRNIICQGTLPMNWIVAIPENNFADVAECIKDFGEKYSTWNYLVPEPPSQDSVKINFLSKGSIQ